MEQVRKCPPPRGLVFDILEPCGRNVSHQQLCVLIWLVTNGLGDVADRQVDRIGTLGSKLSELSLV